LDYDFHEGGGVVTFRTYQVNPPWEAFRTLGGRDPIRQIKFYLDDITVEGLEVTAAQRTEV
jgi:hypothetical protein